MVQLYSYACCHYSFKREIAYMCNETFCVIWCILLKTITAHSSDFYCGYKNNSELTWIGSLVLCNQTRTEWLGLLEWIKLEWSKLNLNKCSFGVIVIVGTGTDCNLGELCFNEKCYKVDTMACLSEYFFPFVTLVEAQESHAVMQVW